MISVGTIAVVIPCFNHGEFLPDAVDSVISIGRNDVQLIVVDDGSTDPRTLREMKLLDSRGIQVIRQQNCGLAAARNAGIAACATEYIIPLDADNRIRPSYIERGVEILNARPKTGVVYGDAEYMGIRSGRWRVGEFSVERLMASNYIDACAVIRRSVWVNNCGYDGSMPVQGAEDWDFWLGAVEHGWEFAYVPEVLFEYRVAAESMLTRIKGFEEPLETFLARKHGLLYRRAWLALRRDMGSPMALSRRLAGSIRARLSGKTRIQSAVKQA